MYEGTCANHTVEDTVEHDLYLRNFAADDKDTAVLNNETNNTNVANGRSSALKNIQILTPVNRKHQP
jgi:hypothetical protein